MPRAAPLGDRLVLERAGVNRGRLSDAAVWHRHRAYYDRGGLEPWTTKAVPTHAPSNAYMAAAYVRVVARFVRACLALPPDHPLAIAPGRPVHVVELGAGTGRLGHLFVRLLDEWQRSAGLALPPIRYVLTDLAEASLTAWQRNPRLAAGFAAGTLDRARFDLARDEAIVLAEAGTRLDAGAAGPLIVLATYVFDSLPADVFRIRDGRLEEGLVDLALDRGAAPHVELGCEFAPADAPYGDSELDDLLAGYAARLGDAAMLFPVGAIDALRRLDRLSGGRLLILTCDKGAVDPAALHGCALPTLAVHGEAVSASLNFDALIQLVRGRGGFALTTRERGTQLQVVGLGLGAAAPPNELRLAFVEAFDCVGPIDVFHVVLDALPAVTTLAQCVALIRLANDDPWVVQAIAPRLATVIAGAPADELARLRRSLRRALTLHLPIEDGDDLFFEIGHLFAAMSRFGEAEPLFQASLEHHGPHAVTYFNLAICRAEQGALAEAIRLLDTCLALEPDFAQGREWRLRFVSELGAT